MTWRGRLWIVIVGLFALLSAGFRPCLTTSDTGGYRISHEQAQDLAAAVAGPSHDAAAAVLYDVDADKVLYAFREHERRAPASTTKIATAMVALKHAPLDRVVTVGPEVQVEGNRVGLVPGSQATVQQLLYATLMDSGNDAAAALAVAVGGSLDQFVLWMNQEAEVLGLRDTHFVNPHGLDAPDHYSSAYDLMVLARTALQNPIFASVVATPQASMDGWTFTNRNELLGQYEGVDGVKTGTTDEAGQCLVVSATRRGHRVLAVVLGSADRYADARMLLDFYHEHYAWERLDVPQNRFSHLEVGASGRIRYYILGEEADGFVPRWERPWLRFGIVVDDQADVARGRFTLGDTIIRELPLGVREL